jgi:hypothetical protein
MIIYKDFMRAALLHNSTALLKEKLLRRHPRENSKLLESNASIHSTPTYSTPAQSTPTYSPNNDNEASASLYEIDRNSVATESSRDETEELDKDIMSLHSAHSQDIWDNDSPEAVPKRNHIWSK